MTTDNNKVSELLVSDELLNWLISWKQGGLSKVKLLDQFPQLVGKAEAMEDELARLRQERDDLVGALRLVIRSCDAGYCGDAYMEISPKTIDIARKVLSKHKPQ